VEEHAILQRWEYCDRLLYAKEHDEQTIIDMLVKQFEVSHFTARNDIYYTQRLFADARKIQKKYLIHHHLDRIDKDLQKVRTQMFATEGEKYIDPKEIQALAKLHETYTYTLNSIPEDAISEKQPPPIFQFILAPGQAIDKPMQIDDAMKAADELILKQNKDGVYTLDE
jgi:hypothetical protein